MGRVFVLSISAAMIGASPLAAQDQADLIATGPAPNWVEEAELAEVPSDAQGLVFVRRNDTLIHLRDGGQDTFVGQHIKLLNSQALQLGNIGAMWNPAAGAPTIHTLRIHRDGETIDLRDRADFEILRREEQLEAATLDGMLTAIYRIPDLRVGDELEFAYSGPTQDPTLGETSAGLLALIGNLQPGRYRLGLNWTEGQKPDIRLTPDFEAAAQETARSLVIDLEDPDVISPPKDAPPRYSWTRVIEFSDFDSWSAVSKRFEPLFAEAATLKAGSPIAAEAARIRAAHADPLDRAAAALELVQAQVRYIYVGLDGGNLRPASAEETWERRYGDCKGKTALLLALLSELGISAEPVLVSNSGLDDGANERLPGPGLFDHVLVRANIGDETYWLDGTLPEVVPPSTRPLLPYRFVLPLTKSGAGLAKLAFEPFALPQEMGLYEIDARGGFDKPARLVTTFVQRGIAGLADYVRHSAMLPSQLLDTYRTALAGSESWDSVSAVSYRYDEDTQASVLSITGTGPVDWSEGSDGDYSLVLPGGGFSPPGRRQRSDDQDSSAPYYSEPSYSCHATTLRFPEGTDLENWGFNTTFDTVMYGRVYYRMMERRGDRTLRMVRGSRTERPEISPENAARDNRRLEKFDNSKAQAFYDPDQVMKPYGDLRPVPAVGEIDWTGRNVPCLPADMME